MQTKPVVYQPLATQQDFGGGYDRSSDRLILSSKETTTDRSRAAVGSGDGNFSTLSQRLVKFVWFPNDPFKVHESKVTLLFSLTVSFHLKFYLIVMLSYRGILWQIHYKNTLQYICCNYLCQICLTF